MLSVSRDMSRPTSEETAIFGNGSIHYSAPSLMPILLELEH